MWFKYTHYSLKRLNLPTPRSSTVLHSPVGMQKQNESHTTVNIPDNHSEPFLSALCWSLELASFLRSWILKPFFPYLKLLWFSQPLSPMFHFWSLTLEFILSSLDLAFPNILNVRKCILNRRRQWHPTPVRLPGKSHGRRNLVGCHLWGHTESDTTEAT